MNAEEEVAALYLFLSLYTVQVSFTSPLILCVSYVLNLDFTLSIIASI